MNYKDVFIQSGISIESLVNNNHSIFSYLPYSVIREHISIEKQIELCKTTRNFLEKLLTYDDISSISPELFVETLIHEPYNYNDISVIEFIMNHDKPKEIIHLILDKIGIEDLNTNIFNILNSYITKYNLLYNFFDLDILTKISNSNFYLANTKLVDDLLKNEEYSDLIKANIADILMKYIERNLDCKDTYFMYDIPDQFINLITSDELDDILNLFDARFKLRFFERCYRDKKYDDDALKLIEKHQLDVYIEQKPECVDVNIQDPYSHFENSTISAFLKNKDKIRPHLFNVGTFIKSVDNFKYLSNLFHFFGVDEKFVVELTNKHTDFVYEGFRRYPNSFLFFFEVYLKSEQDKSKALNIFLNIFDSPMNWMIVDVFSKHDVICPEYLFLLLEKNYKTAVRRIVESLIISGEKNIINDLQTINNNL